MITYLAIQYAVYGSSVVFGTTGSKQTSLSKVKPTSTVRARLSAEAMRNVSLKTLNLMLQYHLKADMPTCRPYDILPRDSGRSLVELLYVVVQY